MTDAAKVRNSITPALLLGANRLRRPCVSGKAAESRGLFFFSRWLLRACMRPSALEETRGKTLLQAADALQTWYKILDNHGYFMPPTAVQNLVACARAHCMALQEATVALAPKHHLLVDLSRSAGRLGNPKYISTYPDETWNAVLKRIAASSHGSTVALTVSTKYHVLCTVWGRDC